MAKLFGFSFEDNDRLSPSSVSPVPPNKEDGADFYLSSGFFGSYVDIEGIYRTEFDLIKRYREMALHQSVIVLLKILLTKQSLVTAMIVQFKLNYQI
jgi:hypothetical protein